MAGVVNQRLLLQSLYHDAKEELKTFNFSTWRELDDYLKKFETSKIQQRLFSFKNRKHRRFEARDLEFLIRLKERHDKLMKLQKQVVSASEELEEVFAVKDTCLLCLCEVEKDEPCLHVCEAEMQKGLTHPPVHLSCFEAQLKSELEGSKPGVIPQIKCFCEGHASGKSHIIPYRNWVKNATMGQVGTYQRSSEFHFQFLCGACHNSKPQLVKFSTSAAFEGSDASEFRHLLHAFQMGALTAFQFYDIISKDFFPAVNSTSKSGWKCMKDILSTIEDPGCRAALQSVHLNKNPYFETLCCDRVHCFRCKTKNFHDGILCEANMAAFDSAILPCARCSLPLTKGDGCDSVVCPCSFSFSWKLELTRYQATIRFSQKFARNTFEICARILCGIERLSYSRDDCLDAFQVRIHNERKIDSFMVSAMREKFGNFVHCILGHLNLNKFTKGVKFYHTKMPEILYNCVPKLHEKTVKYMNTCKKANKSLCYSLFSSDKDRFLALNRFKKAESNSDSKLLESLQTWRNDHPVIYKNCLSKFVVSNVEQFLYFLGQVKVQTKMYTEMGEDVNVSTQVWDRTDSYQSLEYSNNNRSVKRPGNLSSYPAAFCKMNPGNSVNVFTVKLTEANSTSNTISIGIAKVENGTLTFPNSGSDGVGRTLNSFGYFNDRSHSDAALYFNGKLEDNLRSLVLGDEVTVVYDNRFGVCTFCLNENEYRKEVNVGIGVWVFVVTLATEHQLTIIPPRPITPQLRLSSEDLQFFGKNKIRRLNDVEADCFFEMRGFLHYLLRMDIEQCCHAYQDLVTTYANKSLAFDSAFASAEFEFSSEVYFSQAKLLDTDLKKVTLDATWRDFFVGFCKHLIYRRDNKELLERRLADGFAAEFGESAAFIAASYFNSDPFQSSPEDRARGLAYMKFYPEACNDWYEYNASLSDSLLEGLHRISKNCKCLPRCFSRRCKKTNT